MSQLITEFPPKFVVNYLYEITDLNNVSLSGTGLPIALCPVSGNQFKVYYDIYRTYSLNSKNYTDLYILNYSWVGFWSYSSYDVYTLNSKRSTRPLFTLMQGCYLPGYSTSDFNKNYFGTFDYFAGSSTSYNTHVSPYFGDGITPFDYQHQFVSFSIDSISIFIAIIAVVVRLFIFPFWRRLRR